jgi:ornithine carbamoyltransferase
MKNPAMLSVDHSLKKQIAVLYNRIHQGMYGIGVKKQKIEIYEDKIVIFTQQKRVPALSVLSEKYHELTLSADAALIREAKQKLKEELEKKFNWSISTVLQDYDPSTEEACVVICLK